MTYKNIDDNGREVKARKKHYCEWCCEAIEKGSVAVFRKYIFDGSFITNYQHPECFKAFNESLDDIEEGFEQGIFKRGQSYSEWVKEN